VLACFCVFVAGNQQSAVYLPIYGLCFLVGYGWRSMASWKTSLVLIASSMFIAALLAGPVLLPEMEMLLLGQRELRPYQVKNVLTGPLSLSFIFPWVLGTFKTLDLSKIADQMALGFALYPGTIAALLAVFGCTVVIRRKAWTGPVRTAMALVCFYFILICCTPLLKWLYIRASDLALVGFIIFASIGIEEIIARAPAVPRFMKRSFLIITCIVAAMHLFALVIYPKIQSKVESYVLKRDQQNPSLETASELRRAQIASLPREITFQNAGMLAAWLGAGMLMIVGTKVPRKVEFAVFILAVINVVPLLHFGFRFIPRAPIETWHAVLKGGPAIQTARKLVGDSLRFAETDPGRRFNLIPGNTAIYYGIHTLVGYTGLPLFPNGKEFAKREANFVYNNKRVTGADGEFLSPNPDKNVRFIWKNASTRLVQITRETMNTITLEIASGPAATLIRTDTYYPGWHIVEPTNCKWGRDSSGYFAIDVPPNATEVTLAYSPRGLRTAVWVSLGGLLLLSLGAVTIPGMSIGRATKR
jgi:hypothetical protein